MRNAVIRSTQTGKVDTALIVIGSILLTVTAVIIIAATRSGGKHAGTDLGTDLVPVREQRMLMGDVRVGIEIRVKKGNEEAAKKALDAAFAKIALVDTLMSTYTMESELMRLNMQGALPGENGAPPPFVALSDETVACLRAGESWGQRTGGAFSICVPPIARVWRTAEKRSKPPTDDELAAVLALVVKDPLVWNTESSNEVRLKKEGVFIDLSAIAKGQAVDLAIAAIEAAGFEHALVDAGGDVYALGGRDSRGSPWRFGIKDPRAGSANDHAGHDHASYDEQPYAVVALTGKAICTSGDYERFFQVGPERYSHIVDPRTGAPVENATSVSVIAPSAMDADALATALSVMGPEEGLALVEKIAETEALFLQRGEGEELIRHASSGWDAYQMNIAVTWREGSSAPNGGDGDGDGGGGEGGGD